MFITLVHMDRFLHIDGLRTFDAGEISPIGLLLINEGISVIFIRRVLDVHDILLFT